MLNWSIFHQFEIHSNCVLFVLYENDLSVIHLDTGTLAKILHIPIFRNLSARKYYSLIYLYTVYHRINTTNIEKKALKENSFKNLPL